MLEHIITFKVMFRSYEKNNKTMQIIIYYNSRDVYMFQIGYTILGFGSLLWYMEHLDFGIGYASLCIWGRETTCRYGIQEDLGI